ncbi:hypothetical protein [Raoultella terrigena]|uniref:hypothetical protein n=1 Tax=Raoultella terrigena TaxID=577 RepID=UPI0021CB0D0F|nr:hypothetical protein [Raoultella terrigena]
MKKVIYSQDFESDNPVFWGVLVTEDGNTFGRSTLSNNQLKQHVLQLGSTALQLDTDTTYTLSFDYKTESPLDDFSIKIGSGVHYNIMPSVLWVTPTTSWQTASFEFSPTMHVDSVFFEFAGYEYDRMDFDIDNILITTESLDDDDPDDITSVDLTIKAVSGNTAPVIYANGRNQLPVEISAKAMKENTDGSESVLIFSHATWIHILNLCYARSDEKLAWQGSSGWCFTDAENDYSREVTAENNEAGPVLASAIRYTGTGETLITLYVYTDDISTERVAVSIDTEGGKHFTTADNASGAERSSVTVQAVQPITYLKSDLIQDVVSDLGKTQVSLHYSCDDVSWSEKIDAHYDNLYFSVKNKIQTYTVNNYGQDGKSDYRIPLRAAIYWRADNHDQHMLIANPDDIPVGTATLGFYGKATWHEITAAGDSTGIYDFFQTFEFNDRPDTICWTHFSFAASQHWILPDGTDLHVNDTDLYNFDANPWFEFYDLYGNYGAFNIRYNDTTHEIEVDQR